jgi:hypothetical protein
MKIKNTKGFVSIFVVIFTAVLISVVTIGFIRIMIGDHQQASDNDLSRSAYDSALAGVEDAKRVLVKCSEGDVAACAALNSDECNISVQSLADIPDGGSEVTVQNGSNANSLDQAYTCVKVKMDTDNYLGSLSQDSYKIIPLKATSSFNKIKIEWFSAENISSGVVKPIDSSLTSLFSPRDSNTPPVLRSQIIQFSNSGFSLGDLDNSISGTGSNTLFLYPTNLPGIANKKIVAIGSRRPVGPIVSPDSPDAVSCDALGSSVIYSCHTIIELPADIATGTNEAFLVLSAFYNDADFRVTLLDSAGAAVKFNNVQPEVDSTGRANDLFRRVKTRVEMVDANFPYPEAAVDITGSLCKDFSVTDDQYFDRVCKP